LSYPIIQTPPVSTPTAPQTADSMIAEVAALIGGDDDIDARTRALAFLDRAVDNFNMRGIWLVQRAESTYSSLTNGQQTLTMPSDWAWPDDRWFVYDSSERLIRVGEWRVWEHFRSFISDLDTTHYGVPAYASIKSDLSESLVYLYPFINTSNVSKIIMPYFKRIQTVSEAGTSFLVTKEIREALIQFAEFLTMRFRYKDKPPIWRPFEEQAERAVRLAIKAARRMEMGWHVGAVPDETGSLGAPTQTFPFGTVFLVLSGA
jgi:hypothetical protein